MTRDEIHEFVKEVLVDSFELDPSEITGESTLYEELELDSIDAITVFVRLRDVTGRRPDPEDAKKPRTVNELVDFVLAEIEKGPQEEDPSDLFSFRDAASGGEDSP